MCHWLGFCNEFIIPKNHLPMIIKLNTPLSLFVRQKEKATSKPLTLKDKIEADRIVMGILLVLAIISAVILS